MLGDAATADATPADPAGEPEGSAAMSAQPLGRIRGDNGARAGEDRPPAPFVVGLTRSGTTLLRMMLDAHPELTIPPETHFVPDLIKAAARRAGRPTGCSPR